ncbi:MAG: uroporphyrinogen-III C-methyltransferase [Colwellia sp.]
MSDKESAKKTLSANSDTEKQAAAKKSPSSKAQTSKAKPVIDNAASKAPATSKSATKKVTPEKAVNKTASKAVGKPAKTTATIALLIASVSILTSVGHYLWQQQQNSAQLLTLSQQNQQAITQSQAQLKNTLTAEFNRQLQQQHQATSQSQQKAKQTHSDSDTKLKLLAAQINSLEQQVSQRDPSDWLIHEAEYLVRIAARTMWLERDTTAAIGLLRDADNRLKELNHPKFLPVRAHINEDIENLALMPTLTNQAAILTLMALNKQISTLTLASVNLAEAIDEPQDDFVLSNDLNDWQENLAITWQKFLKDFITVRRRTGMVEPLMAPEQQQHLKQNLSLKVQLVQWAASEQKEDIYQQTLLDIQQWLNEFFDMNKVVNKNFYRAIEQLKKQTIYYDYPSDLRSLSTLKRLLDETKQGKQIEHLNVQPAKVQTLKAEEEATSTHDSKQLVSEEVSGGQL